LAQQNERRREEEEEEEKSIKAEMIWTIQFKLSSLIASLL